MRDTIRLMHYDPRWPQEFEQTRSSILHSCQGWIVDVQHIGSTAIPGLIARPVLDVVAAVQDDNDVEEAFDTSTGLIEGLNFRKVETPMWAAETIVLDKPRSGEPTHRVYLTYLNSPYYQNAITIRDQLRSDRELSLRFEATKVARWRHGGGEPKRYADDKAVFFAHLLEQPDDGPLG